MQELNQKMIEVLKTFEEAKSNHQTELKKVTSENNYLKREVEALNDQLVLFTNKQLLFLFEKVKGQKDLIDAPDGQKYTVTYSSPKDLLEAMIYSFNYKKP